MERFNCFCLDGLPAMIPCDEGLWVHYNDIIAEITRLQTIIDKIPTMADGEPALIGEKVFVRWSDGTIEEGTIISLDNKEIKGRFKRSVRYVCFSRVYKTREAAEQGGITDQKAREELTTAIHDILSSYYEETREMDQLRFIVDKYGSTQEEKKDEI